MLQKESGTFFFFYPKANKHESLSTVKTLKDLMPSNDKWHLKRYE